MTGYTPPGFDVGLTIDPVHQFAYMGSVGGTVNPNQSVIVRVNLGNGDAFPPHPISVLNLGVGEYLLTAAVMDVANGNVYFGTDLTYPAHVYMIHVGDGTGPMTEVGRLDMNLGTATSYPPDGTALPGNPADEYGEIFFRSAIIDTTHNAIYFGTDSRPGQVVKVGINGPTTPPALISAVSRKAQGPAGNLDLNLSLNTPLASSTIEPRINGPDQITLTFSEAVHAADGILDATEFTITNATYSSATVSGDTITLNLTNAVNGQYATIAINGIVDATDTTLSGTTSVSIGVLSGDANQDGRVNSLDLNALASSFGKTGETYIDGDFTGDGNVGIADFKVLATQFGAMLDDPPSNSPIPASMPGASQLQPASLFSDASRIDSSMDALEPNYNSSAE